MSGLPDGSALERSSGREGGSGLGKAVMLRDNADSNDSDGLGDDSGLEYSIELLGDSELEVWVALEDILSDERGLIGEYEGALRFTGSSATELRVCTMMRVERN